MTGGLHSHGSSPPAETDWGKCPHGFERGKERLPAGAYAAPLGTCRCCGTTFMYIGRGSYSAKVQETETPDPTLCTSCGGKPRRFRRENGEVVLDEAGSHAQ